MNITNGKKLRLIIMLVVMAMLISACANSCGNEHRDVITTTEAPEIVEPTEETRAPVYGVVKNDEELEIEELPNPSDVPTEVPTEPANETIDSTEATEHEEDPTDSTDETTAPTQTSGEPEKEWSFETYNSMNAADQRAYMESFDSVDDFFAWYNAAKQEYEDSINRKEIGNGPADLGG